MQQKKKKTVTAAEIDLYMSAVDKMVSNREIAGYFGVSARCIEKVFKREYGMTVHQYAMERILDASRPYLLMKPGMTLKQIAVRFGFFDPAHFSKAFQSRFHLSPRQYRARHKTEGNIRLTFENADHLSSVYRSDIAVFGRIESTDPLPGDAVLTLSLEDADGHVLRSVRQTQKDNERLYLYHPDMVGYSEADDPGRAGILKFGFPELLVEDILSPMDSFRNATIKCWYDDHTFKAVFISATDAAHGKIFDDGIGFTDSLGAAYEVLPEGTYLIRAVLTEHNELLAGNCAPIRIWRPTDQAIVRFNPPSHRARITKWCREQGFSVADDILPGYLSPYLGKWVYHMGLLPLYRANDIAFYQSSHVHMFVYLIDPESTSFATELSYLQKQEAVGDPDRFTAYHYDIGEAEICQRSGKKTEAQILPFGPDEDLFLCRLDVADEQAKDHVFELNKPIEGCAYPGHPLVTRRAISSVAVMGVVKPFQMDPDDFVLKPDNTYEITGPWLRIRYEIDDGHQTVILDKPVLLERFSDGVSIGKSLYEFYHVLKLDLSGPDRVYKITMTVLYKNKPRKTACSFEIRKEDVDISACIRYNSFGNKSGT